MLKKYFQRYSEFANGMNHMWITAGYFIFAIFLTICFIYIPETRKTHPLIFSIFTIIMAGLPVLIVVSHIISFRDTITSLRKLVSLYLQIILMFGVIYYFGITLNTAQNIKNNENKSNFTAISGINKDWVKMTLSNHKDKQATFKKALMAFQDCIHFSLITSTTVGYGDFVPASPVAKLLVDIQVLVSCFLIAFGVGSFFNSDKDIIEKRLAAIEKKLDMLNHQ